jgi:hypothetical protein
MAFRRLITGVLASAITLVISQFPAFAFPGDLTAGEYDNTTVTAGFGYFNQTDFSNLSLNLTDATKAYKPVGGAWTSTETRTLQIDFFQASLGFGGDGCYELGPGQATIDSGLGGASVQASITDQTPSCGGSFNSIPLPFDVSMTLTGNGPVRSSRGLTRESCLDYSFVQTTTQALNPASGTATVPAFQPGSLAGTFSLLQSQEQTTHVQGPTHDNCPQEPGATPGGIGPPDPGRYQHTSTVANATQFDDSGSLGVTLTVSTDISSPHSGPSTTTTVMQVSFNMYRNGVFAAGCFNVSPSQFSVTGVQSAQVTLNISDSTPTCYGFPPNMPLPQTLHVAWTTSSPVSNFQFEGGFSCLTYHLTGTGSESTANPAASVSLTPLLGDTVTTTDNSLTTSSNTTIAAGIKQAACHI